MTPDQLNRVTATVKADLDEQAVDLLARRYKRILRKSGRYMARRVRAHSHSLTAAILPPDEDEVIPRDLDCLLYTSPSPRDRQKSRMPSSA